ncbi:MAG: CoA transferase, partial [Anaerolineales bacterium]|nr:CoA transferase [Anaerolineales bacterium]
SLEPKFWQGFCAVIERPDLFGPGLQPDWAMQQQVKGDVRAVIKTKTLAEWTAVFDPLDVCVEPVLTVPEALQHPQAQARSMVANVPKPDGSTQPQIANPFKFSNAQPEYRHIGVPLGTHTREVLAEIGYNDTEIASMRQTGMFGQEK